MYFKMFIVSLYSYFYCLIKGKVFDKKIRYRISIFKKNMCIFNLDFSMYYFLVCKDR